MSVKLNEHFFFIGRNSCGNPIKIKIKGSRNDQVLGKQKLIFVEEIEEVEFQEIYCNMKPAILNKFTEFFFSVA